MKTLRTTENGFSTPADAHSPTRESNPLACIAGSYADDPNWDEFLQALEESRRELDKAEAMESAQ